MALFRRTKPLNQHQIIGRAARAAQRGSRRQRRKAIALYRQAIEAEPNNPDLLRKMARLLVKTKDRDSACTTYRQAIAELRKGGFFNRAVGVCHEALRYLPREVLLWKDLATLEMERSRRVDAVETLLQGRRQFRGRRFRAEAMELLIEAHHIDPLHLDANFDLASLLTRSGDRFRALALLDGLVASCPSSARRIRAKQFMIAPGVHTAWYWVRSLFRAV